MYLSKSIEKASARWEKREREGKMNPESCVGEAIELKDFAGVKNCQVTGIKLVCEHGSSDPRKASLDRLDTERGYVKGNVRLVCAGINSLRGVLSVKEFDKLLKELGQGRERDLTTWVPNGKEGFRLSELVRHLVYRTKDTDVNFEYALELIRETKGVCGLTGLKLDLERSTGTTDPRMLSLDRKDPKRGYYRDNV